MPEAATEPLLVLRDLHKRFGGVRALRGADLTISRAGVVHGLIGENGSGKSTLLSILSGQLAPDAGAIILGGREVRFGRPLDAIRHGISMVSQETALAPHLSVAENIFLGGRMARRMGGIDWRATRARAREVTTRLGLDVEPGVLAGSLAPDQQQLLEIARALSLDARLVILDEPTSSLTDDEVSSLFSVIARLKAEGVSFVFVSHRLGEMTEIADELTVLRDGRTAAQGPMLDFDADRIVSEMVGAAGQRTRDALPRARRASTEPPLLEVRGLGIHGVIEQVDLAVAPGEIVGLSGLIGAGRSELLEGVFGARRIDRGCVVVNGVPCRAASPRASIRAGLGYLPADRKVRGLVLKRRVDENILMVRTASRPRLWNGRHREDLAVIGRVWDRLHIRAATPAAITSTLSGGNQQKVALGKWVATAPSVMLLDEPTRGVDVAAKAEIHDYLRGSARDGVAMLVSSSENTELLALCDRILVMARGRIVASLSAAEADEATLARHGGGHA